ncbi:MAG: serine/threonine-protein kinase [Polyangiaceae bacterium]
MADISPGRIIADRYRIVRRVSEGGMGSVWLGHHLQLDAPVAVKFMSEAIAGQPDARARFEREAKAAAQIRSPYVVHVYDHGIDGATPFIVMEFLEGVDLRQRVRGGRHLPPAEAARICDQICKGLDRAHRLGIIHRDLKPANVFLSSLDDDMVKILDFGIAKETGDRRVVRGETKTGQVLGSPHYMSPEQARGMALDGRSDLWSVAVILYRILTGKRPFDGEDIGDLIVRICTDPVPPPSQLRPELGPLVDAFFERAFQRDPAARHADARSFALAFRQSLAAHLGDDASGAWGTRPSQATVVDGAQGPSSEAPATPTSSKFGPVLGQQAAASLHVPLSGDTFGATTAPPRSQRRVVVGIVAVAALFGGGLLGVAAAGGGALVPLAPAFASMRAPGDAEASAQRLEPSEEPVAEPAVEPTAKPPAAPSGSVAPKPRVPSVPRVVRPQPAPPPPPPKVDIGY